MHAVAGAGLVGGQSDCSSGDVGVAAGLIGVRVVAIVLGDPPPVAEPDQQVAVPWIRPIRLSIRLATSICHHDRPIRANAVQPAASRSRFTVILTL
jgi:hypothetical protein